MFKQVRDERGILSAIEFKQLPFKPKRVFLLHDLNKKERGGHYHKKCKQYLFVISGKCDILLEYKKTALKTTLKACSSGIEVNLPVYTKITIKNASKDCVICVLCSKKYDPKDAYYD